MKRQVINIARKTGLLILIASLTGFLLTGCTRQAAKTPEQTVPETSAAAEAVSGTSVPESDPAATAEPRESSSEAESREVVSPDAGEPFVQQRIVIATDIHYLAKSLSGNRGKSFQEYVMAGDGQVLQHGWEILDAFIEDMLADPPDLIIMSGDLTLNGEWKSHMELAQKLGRLKAAGIQVLVIPGNHDINNPEARSFSKDGADRTETITAGEFAEIYADFGYEAADSKDSASLSYVYELDDYYRIMMLDSCQYEPENQIGGMIKDGTYDWMEEQLEEAWEQGAQVITVSHHNLHDQSGVSREFYDNCTIEHNEELVQVLSDWQVRLHLSGHLHLQHYMEDSGIYEIVTGSLVMAPCQYGELKIMEDGTYAYTGKKVDVDGWAARHVYKNRELADFTQFSENFLRKVTYKHAVEDLRSHTLNRDLFLGDDRISEMASFYAELCVYYYSGRMYEIADEMKKQKEYEYWNQVDYVSELSDFLQNILNDEAKDYSHLEIPY